MSALLLALLVNQARAAGECESLDFSRRPNQALAGHVFKKLPFDMQRCMNKCAQTVGCFSINTYQDGSGVPQCELLGSTAKASPEDFVVKAGNEYRELTVRLRKHSPVTQYHTLIRSDEFQQYLKLEILECNTPPRTISSKGYHFRTNQSALPIVGQCNTAARAMCRSSSFIPSPSLHGGGLQLSEQVIDPKFYDTIDRDFHFRDVTWRTAWPTRKVLPGVFSLPSNFVGFFRR